MAETGLPENVSRILGKDAQRNNILAARIIADVVKTTLGPKGMDKMLVDSTGNITVTNDGVTILEELEVEHPAAKIIVDIAKTQEKEVGDGTTTVALLAGKLLENAEKLLDRRIHATAIVNGYGKSAEKAREIAESLSMKADNIDILKKIAMTAMTGKGAEGNREYFAEILVSAVKRVTNDKFDSNDISIVKIKGERTEKSELIEGVAIEKERANADMPKKVENAKIVLVDFPLELRTPETETKVSISTPEQLEHFLNTEERMLKELTSKLISSGANVIFCQKGIDDVAQYYLAKAGVLAVRRVPRSEMERLAKATSAKIISNSRDLGNENLGFAGLVEEVKQGDEGIIYVRKCKNPAAVTIVIRGSTTHGIDEVERALKDGIGVVGAALESGKIVAGGGAIEIEISRKLKEYSRTLSGREQLVVEEFARSLESIPETLAENAGLDVIDVITELKKRHELGNARDGLNLLTDKIEDCYNAGIIEPLKVKTQAISAAAEVAMLLLRVDDVLMSSGNKNSPMNPMAGMD